METFLLGVLCGAVALIVVESAFSSLRTVKQELDATKENVPYAGE